MNLCFLHNSIKYYIRKLHMDSSSSNYLIGYYVHNEVIIICYNIYVVRATETEILISRKTY